MADSSQEQVQNEGDGEANKPCIIVKTNEERRDARGVDQLNRDKKSRQIREDGKNERSQGDQAETVAVSILSAFLVKRGQMQLLSPPDVVISNHDSTDGTKQRAVSHEPCENVTGRIS